MHGQNQRLRIRTKSARHGTELRDLKNLHEHLSTWLLTISHISMLVAVGCSSERHLGHALRSADALNASEVRAARLQLSWMMCRGAGPRTNPSACGFLQRCGRYARRNLFEFRQHKLIQLTPSRSCTDFQVAVCAEPLILKPRHIELGLRRCCHPERPGVDKKTGSLD